MFAPRAALLALLVLLCPAGALAAPTATLSNRTLTVTGEGVGETLTVLQQGNRVEVHGPAGMNDPDGPGTEPEHIACIAFDLGTNVSCFDSAVDKVVVDGGGGNDTLDYRRTSAPGNDLLRGGAGDDKLTAPVGGLGELTMQGGDGSDWLIRNRQAEGFLVLQGEQGNDTMDAGSGALGLSDFGGPGDDFFNGSAQLADIFLADPGADTYSGGTRTPEPGEVIRDPATYQLFDAADEILYLTDQPVAVSLDGSADDGAAGENDKVMPDVEKVEGGEAGDDLRAGAHPVGLSGGKGTDRLTGGAGDDLLDGEEGSDVLLGGGGDDSLRDGDNTPSVHDPAEPLPPAGNDWLDGGPGSDELESDRGADELIGGPGYDFGDFFRDIPRAPTAPPPSLPAPFQVSLDDVANDGLRGAGEGDNAHSDIEDFATGDGDDVLIGSAGPDALHGTGGNDSIHPGPGADSVSAGSGDDSISAVDGATDRVDCDQGDDRVDADLPGAQPERADVVFNCETVTGTPFGPLATAEDRRAPKLRLKGIRSRVTRRALLRGLRLRVGADEPVALRVSLLVSVRRGRRSRQVTLARASLPIAAGTRTVTLKPARRPRGGRIVKARVRIVAVDAAGNRAVRTLSLRVRG